MNPPTKTDGNSSPWLLIIGLLLGAGFLGFMIWDSFFSNPKNNTESSSQHVVEITTANFKREVVESELPVLVDFTATWCQPCRRLAPHIDRIAEKYRGKVKVAKLDIDKSPDLRDKFGVSAVPTLLLFRDGKVIQAIEPGEASELAASLDKALVLR